MASGGDPCDVTRQPTTANNTKYGHKLQKAAAELDRQKGTSGGESRLQRRPQAGHRHARNARCTRRCSGAPPLLAPAPASQPFTLPQPSAFHPPLQPQSPRPVAARRGAGPSPRAASLDRGRPLPLPTLTLAHALLLFPQAPAAETADETRASPGSPHVHAEPLHLHHHRSRRRRDTSLTHRAQPPRRFLALLPHSCAQAPWTPWTAAAFTNTTSPL